MKVFVARAVLIVAVLNVVSGNAFSAMRSDLISIVAGPAAARSDFLKACSVYRSFVDYLISPDIDKDIPKVRGDGEWRGMARK